MANEAKYPIGIQTFSEIIRGGYTYIDKTDLVWELVNYGKYIFLSRPRRFGKSLLTTTLESYFKGEKVLFEGLKIMDLEMKWEQYPVFHLDLSTAKGQSSAEELRKRLLSLLEDYASLYGCRSTDKTPGSLLEVLLKRASEKTGKQAVVLVDEYDAPLQEVLHEDAQLGDFRRAMQEFYMPLKASERYIKFCFITGITKFSQLSIFSTINNLLNVTMDPRFSAICGITEEELQASFTEGMDCLSRTYECSPEEIRSKLKLRYDGYHFSEDSPEIYNPYSLLKCFRQRKLQNYWFESGTPSFLIRQMQHYRTDITAMDRFEAFASDFDLPTEAMKDALPLLYQSGYLTIKDYDRESELYTLSIPNQEVRVGFTEGLLPAYTGLASRDVKAGFALKFWRALKKDDPNLALQELRVFMAGIPYVEGFKKKLSEAATAEGFYEYTMYLIFTMLEFYVHTQVKVAGGRVDMVVWMPDTIYVFEFKTTGTAQEALAQIDDKGYALPYQSGGRRVVKAGVRFNPDTRIPEDWVIAQA